MSDFSLTAPARQKARIDPHVFAWRDFQNTPSDRALTAWLDAQLAGCDLRDIAAETQRVSARRETARMWFGEHDVTHPRYREAQSRYHRLGDRYRSLHNLYRFTSYRCWMHCCDAYAALQHVPDRAGWLQENATGRALRAEPSAAAARCRSAAAHNVSRRAAASPQRPPMVGRPRVSSSCRRFSA